MEGLRPSFSAHVRLGEHGAPVQGEGLLISQRAKGEHWLRTLHTPSIHTYTAVIVMDGCPMFPGFPVEVLGVGALHADFLNEIRTRRYVQGCVTGNPVA
jgi:hypothetical protein